MQAPTARDIHNAMRALNEGRISPDDYRAVMAKSRELNGETRHQMLHITALANFK